VERKSTAYRPNTLWLNDITGHRTDEGTFYLCAIMDAYSNRIVGHSTDSNMKASLAVRAQHHAIDLPIRRMRRAFRSPIAVPVDEVRPGPDQRRAARINEQGGVMRRQSRDGMILRAAAEECVRPATVDVTTRAPLGDRHWIERTNHGSAGRGGWESSPGLV